MNADYRPPFSGDQPNPYAHNSPEYHRFEADLHGFPGNRYGNYSGGAVPGGASAAGAGAIVAVGAVAAYGAFLYWFYTRTKLGRMWWWAEKRLLLTFGALLFIVYVLPFLVGVVGVPLFALFAPELMAQQGRPDHGPIFILPLALLYVIFFWLRKRIDTKRSTQLPASLSEIDPLTFHEGNDIHRFTIDQGRVAKVTPKGSTSKPSYVVELTGSRATQIRLSVVTAPAVGSELVFAAYTSLPEEPVVVYDRTSGSTIKLDPMRPWKSPGFRRLLLATILNALAMWMIAFIWAGLTMYFQSRLLAIVGLVHGITTYALIFGIPKRIREALRWPSNSVALYENHFLPALVRQVSGR